MALALLTVQGPAIAEPPQVALAPQIMSVAATEQHVSLPSELVAERVREVLRDHRDSEAWSQLAGALPGMAFAGGADLSSTLEAGRLADSISAASSLPTVGGPMSWLPPWLTSLPPVGPLAGPLVGPLVAVLLTLVLLRVVSGMRKGRTTTGQDRQDQQDQQSLGPLAEATGVAVKSRSDLWFAKTLAMSGRPVNEIARQTKMTQDAVLMLIDLQDKSTPKRIANGGPLWGNTQPSNEINP